MDIETRRLNSFRVLKDTSFGTLWWVSNQLWKNDPTFVVQKGTENHKHPGVSLQNTPNIWIPMLCGRSKKYNKYHAIAFKLDDSTDKLSYFGTLKPVKLNFNSFLDSYLVKENPKRQLSDEDKEKLHKFIGRKLQWNDLLNQK